MVFNYLDPGYVYYRRGQLVYLGDSNFPKVKNNIFYSNKSGSDFYGTYGPHALAGTPNSFDITHNNFFGVYDIVNDNSEGMNSSNFSTDDITNLSGNIF